MHDFEDGREGRRHFIRRNWFWMVPLGLVAGAAMFVGVGFLVAWLWRVTLGDIFGVKPISFWQAWGLILLSQILFKANLQRNVGVGRSRRGRFECPSDRTPGPAEPGQAV